jgi:hypothetical protein
MKVDVVGLSVGIVVSIIVAYYFYRKSLRIKEPCWAIRSNNLVQGYSAQLEDLKIRYNNVNVENLTISRILFWNNGAQTIDKVDLDTVNHLRINCIGGIKLLDVKILTTNNQSCQFTAAIDNNKTNALLYFDYLDKNQGAIIQIVHSGMSSKDLTILGDIKGGKTIVNKYATPTWVRMVDRISISRRLRQRIISAFAVFSGVYFILGGIANFFMPITSLSVVTPSGTSAFSRWFFLIFLPLSGVLMIYMGMTLWRRMGVAPKGLESFYDNRS